MTEANAEYGQFAGELLDDSERDSRVIRSAWTRRDHNFFRLLAFDLSEVNFVVAINLNNGAEFTEVLDEVVSEGVVVVDY